MRPRILLATTLAIALAGLTACGDADPAGLAESAEAEAVLRSAEALPSLVALIEAVASEDPATRTALTRAHELWVDGTAVDDPRASNRRRLAISYALPALHASLPAAHWTAVRDGLDDWMSTAGTMLRHLELPAVERRIDRARHHLERADRATNERSRQFYLLLAASELVETTPRHVARTLSADAALKVQAAASDSAEDRGELSEHDLERAHRLKDWSARAVHEGDYLLAIQRAYYAIQLVSAR